MTAADELAEIEACIEEMQLRLDRPAPGADIPGTTGLLGLCWLRRYDVEDAEWMLQAGLGHLADAYALAPTHPDRRAWLAGLASGHSELAMTRRDRDEFDRAIGWWRLVLADLSTDDPEHDEVTGYWLEICWYRYLAARGDTDPDPLAEVGGLLGHLDEVSPLADTAAGASVHVLRGFALLDRYDVTDDRTDLNLGISLLSDTTGGTLPDVPSRRLYWLYRGDAYQNRYELDGDPVDLDRAIEAWLDLLATEPPDLPVSEGVDLLRQRFERSGAVGDLDTAITLLEGAVGGAEADRWQAWRDLAAVLQLRATTGGASAADERIGACLDRAIELFTAADTDADGDDLAVMHLDRLTIALGSLENEVVDPLAGPPPTLARTRRLLDESGTLLDGRGDEAVGPGWSVLAFQLARGELGVIAYGPGSYDGDRIRRRLDLARQLPDAPEGWTIFCSFPESLTVFADGVRRLGDPAARGLDQLIGLLTVDEPAGIGLADVQHLLAVMMVVRALRGNNLRMFRAADVLFADGGLPQPAPHLDADVFFLRAMFALHRATFGDPTALRALVAEAAETPVDPTHTIVAPMLHLMRMADGAIDLPPMALPELSEIRPVGSGLDEEFRLIGLLATALVAAAQAEVVGDQERIRAAAQFLDALVEVVPDDLSIHPPALGGVALSWLKLAQRLPHDRQAAHRAQHAHERALAVAGRPESPLRTELSFGLAESLRLVGGVDNLARSRRLGLTSLRSLAWQVLAQSGTEYALKAARRAGDRTAQIAAWCIADGADEEVLDVLDAGRGLTLMAATVARDVPAELEAAGRPDLAREWRETNGLGRDPLTGSPLSGTTVDNEVPDDLNERVLRVLLDRGARSPGGPSLPEIRGAMGTVGADALAYLLPASRHGPGAAVVVPLTGALRVLSLPDLTSDAVRMAEGPPGGNRDLEPPAEGPPIADLDSVCRWGWSAAASPLIGCLRPTAPDRRLRLVVIPMGVLGLVPWHAACWEDSAGRRHYAVEDAVWSYSVSARAFCESARHPTRAVRSALIVGDPSGDLAFAGLEARAIQRRFYPNGTYLGDGADATGSAATPAAVLAWLAHATGPSLLHLSCHGRAEPSHPGDSHLVLAGGEILSVRNLFDASRLAELELDQVYLAACTTSTIGVDYDESLSLATAFVAAGAHTVFGALWPVPDAETSLLMYLVHHHLNADACAPVDALHRAQLWMLDPDRKAPPGMPAPLTSFCTAPSLASPVAWAGLIHQGR
jgi:hypothetical protein